MISIINNIIVISIINNIIVIITHTNNFTIKTDVKEFLFRSTGYMKDKGYKNIFRSEKDLNDSFMIFGEK